MAEDACAETLSLFPESLFPEEPAVGETREAVAAASGEPADGQPEAPAVGESEGAVSAETRDPAASAAAAASSVPVSDRASDPADPTDRPASRSLAALSAAVPASDPEMDSLIDGIVGQPDAARRLTAALASPVPSYLFVGPAGADVLDAAVRFAGELLAADSPRPHLQRRLALARRHADIVVFERSGATLSAGQARDAVREASTAPATGRRKVVIICDADRAAQSAPILLKSVEEPPPSSVFILLAAEVGRRLETLASRCVRIDFRSLGIDEVAAVLQSEGIAADRARQAAQTGADSLERARLLARDDDAAARVELWLTARQQLNGTGAAAARVAEAVLAGMQAAAEPLDARQSEERAAVEQQAEQFGLRLSRSSLDDRHKREQRRLRSDEFSMGLSLLAGQIREEAVRGELPAEQAAAQMAAVSAAHAVLVYNGDLRTALVRMLLDLSS